MASDREANLLLTVLMQQLQSCQGMSGLLKKHTEGANILDKQLEQLRSQMLELQQRTAHESSVRPPQQDLALPGSPGVEHIVPSSRSPKSPESNVRPKTPEKSRGPSTMIGRNFLSRREDPEEILKRANKESYISRVSEVIPISAADPAAPPPRERYQKHQVFADAEGMKEKLKHDLMQPEYKVSSYYHEQGCAQFIARSNFFEVLTLGIIAINSVWIWVDTDFNKSQSLADADAVFVVAENFFCVYFTFEWLGRFLAFNGKRNCLKDAWFVFDSALLLFMVLETWCFTLLVMVVNSGSGSDSDGPGLNLEILKLFRLLRLTRMARMAKLLRQMPELMVMIKAMSIAMRSVVYALLLLAGIIYVFAVAFTQMMDGDQAEEGSVAYESFRSVRVSMHTLLIQGGLPEHTKILEDSLAEHFAYFAAMLVYVFLCSMTVMNMLVGILCEVIAVVSSVEKEEMLITSVKTELERMMRESSVDADGSGRISKEEWYGMLDTLECARTLQDFGVDVLGLVDLSEFIFEEHQDLTFPDFLEIVLSLRGTNAATVKDVVSMRKFLSTQVKTLQAEMRDLLDSAKIPKSAIGDMKLDQF